MLDMKFMEINALYVNQRLIILDIGSMAASTRLFKQQGVQSLDGSCRWCLLLQLC